MNSLDRWHVFKEEWPALFKQVQLAPGETELHGLVLTDKFNLLGRVSGKLLCDAALFALDCLSDFLHEVAHKLAILALVFAHNFESLSLELRVL